MPRKDQGIAAAFTRARAGDLRLGPWMVRHYDELLHELGSGRIEWAAPLAAFADLGLTDEHGRPPTRDTASRTWRRAREAVAAARKAETRARPARGELVPGVRLVVPSISAAPAARPAPSPAASNPAAAAPASGGVDEATERIRAALDAMGAARVPLPQQPHRTSPADARPARNRTPT